MNRLQANALLLMAGAIWGMGFVAQSTAMESVGPFLFIALRFLTACVAVLPFVWLEAVKHRRSLAVVSVPTTESLATSPPDGRNSELDQIKAVGTTDVHPVDPQSLSYVDIVKFALIGLALFGGMAAQQVGLLSTSVTNSGFLTGLYVVFTPLVAISLFREKPHPVIWYAAALALTGIYFLAGGDLGALVLGDILTIISALFWAIQVVLIARFVGQSGRPLALSFIQFLVTAVLAGICALLLEPIIWERIVAAAPQILYTGVFASGVAFTVQAIGQRYTTAPQAAIFLSSEAPFAALFAALWLGERIGLIGIGGCALIFAAMLLVELYPEWQARRKLRVSLR